MNYYLIWSVDRRLLDLFLISGKIHAEACCFSRKLCICRNFLCFKLSCSTCCLFFLCHFSFSRLCSCLCPCDSLLDMLDSFFLLTDRLTCPLCKLCKILFYLSLEIHCAVLAHIKWRHIDLLCILHSADLSLDLL